MARTFLRDSAGLAASQYVARAMLLARGVAAAAALGPGGFGAWNALNLILDYGAYASLGTVQGLDLVLPPAAARGERSQAQRAMQGAWWVTLVGAAAFAAGVALLLVTGRWVSTTGWGWGPPALMLAATMVQLALLYHASVLRAHGDFTTSSVGLGVQAVIGGGLGLITVWRVGVWGLLWGWIVGGLCAVAWMRRSPWRPPLAPAEPREGYALVVRGLPIFAFFALTLVLRSLDRIALVRFADNQALGLYSLGLTASALVLYLPEAASAVLFPRVAAAAQGARDVARTRREVLRAHVTLMAVLPALVGLGVLCAPGVLFHALPAFASSIAPLRVLAIAALALSMGGIPSYYLLASGRAGSVLFVPAAAVLVAGVAIFATASVSPHPESVAWATTAGYAFFALAMLGVATKHLASEPRERAWLWISTLVPVGWAAALILVWFRIPDATLTGTVMKCFGFLALDAPVALIFGAVVPRSLSPRD